MQKTLFFLFLLLCFRADAQPARMLLFGRKPASTTAAAPPTGMPTGMPTGNYITAAFSVTSSIDAGQSGSGRFRFDSGLTAMPLVLFLHGWGGNANNLTDADLTRWANYGFFAASVDSRQSRNVGGREAYDLYDIVQYLTAAYPGRIDPQKVSFVGYSNGGGMALQMACKFPDLFGVTVAYFPMSDFGFDPANGWYQTNPGFAAGIAEVIGGTPTAVPNRYRAKNTPEAITNYRGYLYGYHDADDGQVSVIHSRRIRDVLSGSTRFAYDESSSATTRRYSHANPSGDIITAEADWKGRVLTTPRPTMPASGTLRVIGFLKTAAFSIWLNNGENAVADLQYNTTTKSYTITPLTGSISVSVAQGGSTQTATLTTTTTITLP